MNESLNDKDIACLGQLPFVKRLTAQQHAVLARLAHLLLAANERTNLTAVRTLPDVFKLHFADSLAALEADPKLLKAASAADLGSGAGFPLFPLAVALPDCQWTAIESANKKCTFIGQTAGELGLMNVQVQHGRAEDLGRAASGALRGRFDFVTARAVGAISALCECGLPLLSIGGTLLLFKTENALPDLEDSHDKLRGLGGELLPVFSYRLDGDVQDRVILRIEKVSETPNQYPRVAGVPFKKPLF
jgi:16S rRNA (guanine527-N7)-methyltransferase